MILRGIILFTLLRGAMLSMIMEGTTIIHTPRYRLSNGYEMPGFALGTYLGFHENRIITSRNKEVRNAVAKAIDLGYRHIDTAPIYETETEVGEALTKKIHQHIVKRENMFITSKLWNTSHRKNQVEPALRATLTQLGLAYIDLYLMHWPIALNDDYSFADVDFMETWQGMEEVVQLGLTKSIGVSNFNKTQLQRLLSESTIKPVVLQIEVHPQIIQQELIDFCKREKIIVMAYSPLGSLVERFGLDFPGPKVDHPLLVTLANKYKKTPIQIVLRWAVDRGLVPLPKTVNNRHLSENLHIFDFRLLPEEVEHINAFDSNTRYTRPSFWQDHPHYPFDKVVNPVADPFRSA